MVDDGQRKHAAAGEPDDEVERTHFMPTAVNPVDEGEAEAAAEPPPRPRAHPSVLVPEASSWRHNPLVWVLLVVAMFLSVPLLSECSMGARRDRAAKPAAAASSAEPAAVTEPAVVPSPEPARTPTAGSLATPKNVQAAPRPPADGSRQMITKCVERGRIVYTQTGECSGNVSAVPIDTDKNVVGNEKPAREGAARSP
jgi:hypothetical protein